jgi:sulfite dehydrogenase (cytochrome) subunit B
MKIPVLASIAALALATLAIAGEEKVKLKDGPNVDLVRNNCVACHSLDYIPLNSPFLDAKGWEATVTKMQKAYGAPIKAEDAAPIAEYLAQHYGKR